MSRRTAALLLCAWALLGGVGLSGAAGPDDPRGTDRYRPVLHNGRVKPFDSFARETLYQITGRPAWGRQDPVETLRSILDEPNRWQEELILSVPFVPLREALGMSRKTTHISYAQLVSERKLMRMLPPIVEKQQRDEKLSMLENETMDLYGRFVALSRLFQREVGFVSPDSKDAPARWRLHLEVLYNRLRPFVIARILYTLACLGLLVGLVRRGTGGSWGLVLLWAGFGIHLAGILARVILGGRPPVSNFYETMLWLPFVAVGLALLFERIHRTRWFALAAGIVAAIFLALADYVPLDPSIVPVVAVLRSNLWLSVHVLTIVASYGALALATVLAHLAAGVTLFRPPQNRKRGENTRDQNALELYLYRAIQVGVVLLASGIMLGGVWANASWGRYWGWDPKETWALITLLWFLALLHGRFAGWIRGAWLSLGTIAGFFLLLMTYYGVSFYLVGLHSYAGGSAKPVPALLIGYVAAEVLFMALVAVQAARGKSQAA